MDRSNWVGIGLTVALHALLLVLLVAVELLFSHDALQLLLVGLHVLLHLLAVYHRTLTHLSAARASVTH